MYASVSHSLVQGEVIFLVVASLLFFFLQTTFRKGGARQVKDTCEVVP